MTDPGNPGPARSYALGHAGRELARLELQERVVGPMTRQFLREAGIVPGMRVLDVGSGTGSVSFIAADLVGETGEVIGADKSAAAVAAAQAAAAARGLGRVSFRAGDPAEIAFERPFDAVIGRYVLMFIPDAAAALRRLARHLRPGGTIFFHEVYWDTNGSFPGSPLYERCNRWIVETFRRLGPDTRMGAKLHAAFVAAGLPAPAMRAHAVVGGADGAADWLLMTAELVRTLLPETLHLGIATAAEVDIDTLAERLRREVANTGGVIFGRAEIGAWARV